ncbi:MAG: flavodoxin family protein [Lachnospiraceae bacterium]|nr:flavodoxin family protein [Lachnospiraceae bacterium]
MRVAVRYYSRTGNTKAVAEAIAKTAGVAAVSVDTDEAAIKEPIDILFIGGALYAYGLDNHLKEYLATLKKDDVKKAVVFSTSWLSKHSIDLIKRSLTDAGIPVEAETFYLKSKEVNDKLKTAEEFASKFV